MANTRLQPHETFATSRPRKGDPVSYRGEAVGKVHRVEEGLLYVEKPDGEISLQCIWCFRDGLNSLHSWPSKQPDARQVGDPQ